MVRLRLLGVAAALLQLGCAAATSHACDKNCICDGVDLSRLRNKMYTMHEMHAQEGSAPDEWKYRMSVCEPLPREQIPINCIPETGHHLPYVVRFKDPHRRNQSAPTGDCQQVGSDVVLAQATRHNRDPADPQKEVPGVQLVLTGEDGGKTHTVTANMLCDYRAGDANVRSPQQPCNAKTRAHSIRM